MTRNYDEIQEGKEKKETTEKRSLSFLCKSSNHTIPEAPHGHETTRSTMKIYEWTQWRVLPMCVMFLQCMKGIHALAEESSYAAAAAKQPTNQRSWNLRSTWKQKNSAGIRYEPMHRQFLRERIAARALKEEEKEDEENSPPPRPSFSGDDEEESKSRSADDSKDDTPIKEEDPRPLVQDTDEEDAHPPEPIPINLDVLMSKWWVRLGETVDKIYETNQENGDDDMDDIFSYTENHIPTSRRGHAASVYAPEDHQEYMIITGGFNDNDWNTFPLWSYDVTEATYTNTGTWSLLADGCVDGNEQEPNMEIPPPGEWQEMSCPPTARMGHASVVRGEELYVFGGLLYNDHTAVFYPEVEPFVYKINLREAYPPISQPRWSRLVPHVKNDGDEEDGRKDLLRGDLRGGYWNEQD